MKIAVVTAIFGGKDNQKPFPAQSVECDYFCFTEKNSPVPLPNLPDRLKAKYFKLQMHRVLPGYDAYVWIDGNIEVKSPDFVRIMTYLLDGIRIQRHHERQTIKEEIDFILASENEYLTTRYGAQPLKQEYEYYLSKGMPDSAPLYSCNVFSFYNGGIGTGKNGLFFNAWWNLVLAWSWFDQSAFSFLAEHCNKSESYVAKIHPINLGPMFNNPYFTLHSHTKPLE
jgi:hypothetical protein